MFKGRFKKILVSTLALVMVMGTVAFASGVKVKNIPATYGRIKFQRNGVDITNEVNTKYGSPAFVSGGRSYVPVRAISEILDMKVDWDEKTHTANIIDTKAAIMQQELNKKNKEIKELEAEIKELKEGVVSKGDLSDLEKELNKDFGTFSNLDFDIILRDRGNDKIEVSVETDLRTSRDERYWETARDSDKKAYIENIVNAIQKDFPKSDVEGIIYDNYNRTDLYIFSKKSKGNLVIKDRDYDKKQIEEYASLAVYEDLKSDAKMSKLNEDDVTSVYEERNRRVVTTVISNDLGRRRDMETVLTDLDDELRDKFGSDLKFEVVIKKDKGDILAEFYNGRYYE